MSIYHIYTLTCPITNKVKYVGKTKNMARRYQNHISGGSRVRMWVFELRKSDIKPIMVAVEYGTNEQMRKRERYWVEYYCKLEGSLLNKQLNILTK